MVHLKKISRPKVSRRNNKSLRAKINDTENTDYQVHNETGTRL